MPQVKKNFLKVLNAFHSSLITTDFPLAKYNSTPKTHSRIVKVHTPSNTPHDHLILCSSPSSSKITFSRQSLVTKTLNSLHTSPVFKNTRSHQFLLLRSGQH